MPSLKKIRAKTDDIKVSWGEETVALRWRPGLLTDSFYESLARIHDEARAAGMAGTPIFATMRGKLAELIEWWDLTEEEGPEGPGNPMVAITAEGLAELPEGLLLRITEEILAEGQGGEASGRSGSGGRAGAPSDTSHDGPHSFG